MNYEDFKEELIQLVQEGLELEPTMSIDKAIRQGLDCMEFDGDIEDFNDCNEDEKKGFYFCSERMNAGFDKDDLYEISATIGEERFDAEEFSLNEIDEIAEKQKIKIKEYLKNGRKV